MRYLKTNSKSGIITLIRMLVLRLNDAVIYMVVNLEFSGSSTIPVVLYDCILVQFLLTLKSTKDMLPPLVYDRIIFTHVAQYAFG